MNLLTVAIFLLGIFTTTNSTSALTNSSNHLGEKFYLVKSDQVKFAITNLDDARSFKGVTYNNITKILKIDAKENIAFFEVMNETGESEYVLPVGVKYLNIDLLDFEKGNYIFKFKIQEVGERIISTYLEKTF